MRLTRRSLIAAASAGFMLPAFADTDPTQTPRFVGSTSAPITVTEFFSFTCPHCAAFTRETFPEIKTNLIDTGKLRWVFWDYPLDQTALTASMVARSLPPDFYEPFMVSLFQDLMRWAYNTSIDPIDGLAQQAALAGMPRATYDKVRMNTALQNFVLQERADATSKYMVDSTPTFRADGPKAQGQQKAGEMSYDDFTAFLATVG